MRYRRAHQIGLSISLGLRFLWLLTVAACILLTIPTAFGQELSSFNLSAQQSDDAFSPGLAAASLGEDSAEAAPVGQLSPSAEASTPTLAPSTTSAAASQSKKIHEPAGGDVAIETKPAEESAEARLETNGPATAAKTEANRSAPEKDASTVPSADPPNRDTLAGECAYLLWMATRLKAEVNKTTKDELSVAVVRDAARIEVLAHNMREDPKQH